MIRITIVSLLIIGISITTKVAYYLNIFFVNNFLARSDSHFLGLVKSVIRQTLNWFNSKLNKFPWSRVYTGVPKNAFIPPSSM